MWEDEALAIEINNVSKQYKGGKVAVDDISFSVRDGEIFGFLGPNGAGKSTTLKMLTTILKPTSGTVRIKNIDVLKEPLKARMQFGYVPQEASVDDKLTGRENLYFQAKLYHLNDGVREKVEHILKLVKLTDEADKAVSSYSGGMKKRLEIGCALMNTPKVLFLDEPTLGLDIQSRKEIWQYIKMLNKDYGTTVFLTTHYLEEADEICDTISIIDGGKISVIDSPKNLKASIGNEIVEITLKEHEDEHYGQMKHLLEAMEFVHTVKNVKNVFTVVLDDADSRIMEIYEKLNASGLKVSNISLKKVTLDDVYLHYTGKNFKEADSKLDELFKNTWMGA